jgi:glyoxylase-like metal-dependent hydrolase (beta-lactamase superfamily II)
MTLQIADRWYEWRRIDDDITFLWEPHVVPLMRCNMWLVRGRDRDMLVDTGMGLVSLREAAREVFEKPVTAVATHAHSDHIGSHHEFEERVVHALEAADLAEPYTLPIDTRGMSGGLLDSLLNAGYHVPESLIEALPHEGYDTDAYIIQPAPPTRIVEEGSIIDIGDRQFEVMHLPGHSPGSIGLYEEKTGILIAGDAVYDGPLIYEGPGTDLGDYAATLERLKALPVSTVHGGHDPSFGRARLVEICDDYLSRWAS